MKFEGVKGIICGSFTKCTAENPTNSLDLKTVFEDKFQSLDIPVLFNFPVGHEALNCTLPLGVKVEINFEKASLRFLENAVK